jgi:hypothetical protein
MAIRRAGRYHQSATQARMPCMRAFSLRWSQGLASSNTAPFQLTFFFYISI